MSNPTNYNKIDSFFIIRLDKGYKFFDNTIRPFVPTKSIFDFVSEIESRFLNEASEFKSVFFQHRHTKSQAVYLIAATTVKRTPPNSKAVRSRHYFHVVRCKVGRVFQVREALTHAYTQLQPKELNSEGALNSFAQSLYNFLDSLTGLDNEGKNLILVSSILPGIEEEFKSFLRDCMTSPTELIDFRSNSDTTTSLEISEDNQNSTNYEETQCLSKLIEELKDGLSILRLEMDENLAKLEQRSNLEPPSATTDSAITKPTSPLTFLIGSIPLIGPLLLIWKTLLNYDSQDPNRNQTIKLNFERLFHSGRQIIPIVAGLGALFGITYTLASPITQQNKLLEVQTVLLNTQNEKMASQIKISQQQLALANVRELGKIRTYFQSPPLDSNGFLIKDYPFSNTPVYCWPSPRATAVSLAEVFAQREPTQIARYLEALLGDTDVSVSSSALTALQKILTGDTKAIAKEAEFALRGSATANINSATLSGLDFRPLRLQVINAQGASLLECRLDKLDLRQSNFHSANLSRSNLSGSNLNLVDLTNVQFHKANLNSATLYSANLSGADLSGADLSGAELSNALLTQADLSGALVNNANFSNAIGIRAEMLAECKVLTSIQGVPVATLRRLKKLAPEKMFWWTSN